MSNKYLIKQALDDYASIGEPEDSDLWPSVLMHIRTDPYSPGAAALPRNTNDPASKLPSSARTGQAPTKRQVHGLSFAGLAMLVVIVAGVAALALRTLSARNDLPVVGYTNPAQTSGGVTVSNQPSPTPTTAGSSYDGLVFDFDSGDSLKHVKDLGTLLNVTQSIGAYSVTLHRAYADANHIVVEYSVQGPQGEHLAAVDTGLVNPAGDHFSQLFAMKDVPGSVAGSYAIGFDASTLQKLPGQLQLSLSLSLVKVEANGVEPPVLPDLGPNSASGVGSWSNLWEKVAGPFKLDFVVPVTQAGTRFAEVNQTVEAAGLSMTLERVIVTPGETRIFLSYDPPQGDHSVWTPGISLQAGDYASGTDQSFTEITRSTSSGKWSYSIFEDLTGKQGEWTITVSELKSGDDFAFRDGVIQRSNQSKAITGPWVFKFAVPAAAKN